jgi:hypothetical protein
VNRLHTRKYRSRPRLALRAAALGAVTASLALAVSPSAPGARAAESDRAAGQGAHAELAELTLTPVASLGIDRFHGTYGIADSPRVGTSDNGDFTDPDGVLTYLVPTGQRVTRTSNASAQASAQAQISGVTLMIGTTEWAQMRPKVGSIGSLDTYAECTPPPIGPYAQAYARTDSNELEVLGHTVPLGTTTLHVTGAELHHPSTLGDSTLTVTYEEYQDPPGGAPAREYTAHAGLRVHVTGTLVSTQGDTLYQGDILDLRLGEVTADCSPATSPSPTPTKVTPTPTPTVVHPTSPPPSPTASASPSPSPTASASPSPLPTAPPASPSPGGPGAPGPGPTAPPGGPGSLAGTGSPTLLWLLGLSATLILAGTGLVLRARRDIRS